MFLCSVLFSPTWNSTSLLHITLHQFFSVETHPKNFSLWFHPLPLASCCSGFHFTYRLGFLLFMKRPFELSYFVSEVNQGLCDLSEFCFGLMNNLALFWYNVNIVRFRMYCSFYILCCREGWCTSMHSVQSTARQVSAVTSLASITCPTVWVEGRRSDSRCTGMQHVSVQVSTQPLHAMSTSYLSKCQGQDEAIKAPTWQMDRTPTRDQGPNNCRIS